MGRKLLLTTLVLALGLSLSIANAAPAAYVVKGTMTVTGGANPTFHAVGVLCGSPTCKVSKSKTKFDLLGEMTQKLKNRCLGVGHATLTIFWPNGSLSKAYLDIFPLTGRSISALGIVLTGARKRARIAATSLSTKDPCAGPAALSGLLAISA